MFWLQRSLSYKKIQIYVILALFPIALTLYFYLNTTMKREENFLILDEIEKDLRDLQVQVNRVKRKLHNEQLMVNETMGLSDEYIRFMVKFRKTKR